MGAHKRLMQRKHAFSRNARSDGLIRTSVQQILRAVAITLVHIDAVLTHTPRRITVTPTLLIWLLTLPSSSRLWHAMQPGERRRFSSGIARSQHPRLATAVCGSIRCLRTASGQAALPAVFQWHETCDPGVLLLSCGSRCELSRLDPSRFPRESRRSCLSGCSSSAPEPEHAGRAFRSAVDYLEPVSICRASSGVWTTARVMIRR
jgi:hypothetical protein